LAADKSENRRERRIKLKVPATVKAGEHTLAASTRDISVGGLFLITDSNFKTGSEIEVVLMLPKEVGLPFSEMVCCHAEIVRVELSGGEYGVAAEIKRIAALPQV